MTAEASVVATAAASAVPLVVALVVATAVASAAALVQGSDHTEMDCCTTDNPQQNNTVHSSQLYKTHLHRDKLSKQTQALLFCRTGKVKLARHSVSDAVRGPPPRKRASLQQNKTHVTNREQKEQQNKARYKQRTKREVRFFLKKKPK